jgi:sulfotransferase
MTRTIHLLTGLPRGGAVVLSNLLAQNPRLHTTSTGGILTALMLVRNDWAKLPAFHAAHNEVARLRVLRGMLESYYADVPQPVVFDRSLGWLGGIEMTEAILERPAKIIVCVRDIRDVLATFELQWRTVPAMREFIHEHPSFPRWETVEGRCAVWADGEEPLGIAYNQIKDALARGYRDRLHFVEYEKLTRFPGETMAGIYKFIGEKPFTHDFNNIRQVVWENYSLYGVPERHDIPPRLVPAEPLWPEVLGAAANRYAGQQLWQQPAAS